MTAQPTDPAVETVQDLPDAELAAADATAVKGGLVVNAIIGILMPLLLPAVQKTPLPPPPPPPKQQ
jgi:hypothetical protein